MPWLLAAGTFADGGVWDDDALWLDGPPALPRARGPRLLRVPRPVTRLRPDAPGDRGPIPPIPPALWLIGPDTIITPGTRIRGA